MGKQGKTGNQHQRSNKTQVYTAGGAVFVAFFLIAAQHAGQARSAGYLTQYVEARRLSLLESDVCTFDCTVAPRPRAHTQPSVTGDYHQ